MGSSVDTSEIPSSNSNHVYQLHNPTQGNDGGLVISILAFFYGNLALNSAEVSSSLIEKNLNKHKEPLVGPNLKNLIHGALL